ncbi:MAG: hypothetical protein GVY07_08460 [Bacteroidetes bacterium]|jgi:hypothetical protein|nr:hypothetical protein [Bacteroidota bacterium]
MKTIIKENSTAAELKNIFLDKSRDNQDRYEAIHRYSEVTDPAAFDILKNLAEDRDEGEFLKEDAVRAMGYLKSNKREIDDYLIQLATEGRNKRAAIQSLAVRGKKEAIPFIIDEILNSSDSYLKQDLAQDLKSKFDLNWEERLEMILNAIKVKNIRPEAIDEEVIVTAIIDEGAALTVNKDHMIEVLIQKSIDQDKRMTGVYAKLIVELSSKSQSVAGQKVSEFEIDHNIESVKLKNLRIAIGGDTAIDSLLGVLQTNLEKYFQIPILNLNTDTHQNWKKTIKYAQYGFMMRMIMSVVVFIVGILLLCISSYAFFMGNSTGEELFGVGISFVAGLGTMLTVIYTGPLRQIRESVNDLGIASAAFIAYVHRVLEISHTFSFYYLNQNITFEEMEKSSELIDKAMRNTIELLSDKSAKIEKPKPSGTTTGQ